MCRIIGICDFNYKKNYNLTDIIISMRDTMLYGGPDDCGIYIDENYGFALGHRRLAILDLSDLGHQPMEFDNLVIVYNGEVYNFKEIRKELENYNYKFYSNTDTEVILKSFHKWNIKCVEKFRGMFAFAIWDKKEKKLYLFRDRIGVKPLYWYYKNGLFMFSSEIKAFHKHPRFEKKININSLSLFLKYGYITSPLSIFEDVYKIEPGSIIILDNNGKINIEKYWEVTNFFIKGLDAEKNIIKKNEDEIANELENIITDCFKLRLISDVEVGVFLSGGIDSSLLTAILSKEKIKIKTFTIGFNEKKYNEANYAKKIANYLGTSHNELYCSIKDAVDIIPNLGNIYDEPFADSSSIPTYLLTKFTKDNVKVALSADGGDEQFCGYSKYWELPQKINILSKIHIKKLVNIIDTDKFENLYKKIEEIIPLISNIKDKHIRLKEILNLNNFYEKYESINRCYLNYDFKSIGIKDYIDTKYIIDQNLELPNSLMLLDIKTYLPDDIMVKIDRASMSVALEAREPFLDHKILEYSSILPLMFKYKNKKGKYILRKILSKYLPEELWDRPKQGFGSPIYEWFKEKDLKEFYLEYLSEEKLKKDGIFKNTKLITETLNRYLEGKKVNHNKLWFLFIFQQWKEKWLK